MIELVSTKVPLSNCCTHTLSNAGKRAIGGGKDGSVSFTEQFCKMWQAIINTPGKARDRFAMLFGHAPITASGVRFFVRYEQVDEIYSKTPYVIMDIVQWCIANNVWEESAKNDV